jgi:Flp pilus assembly protein TadG
VSFPRGEGGSVAIIFALLLIPLLLAVGVAVDYLRAYQARTVLQEVVDAAGLAAGADASATDAVVIATARKYVDANIAPHIQQLRMHPPVTTVSPQVDPVTNKRTIVITATSRLDTTFMRLVNIMDLPLSAVTDIQRTEAGPQQVVLVLDATNSMTLPLGSRTRMAVLKEAALSLVDVIMDPPNQGGGIGIVPFALRVNLNGVNLGVLRPHGSTFLPTVPGVTQAPNAGCPATRMVLRRHASIGMRQGVLKPIAGRPPGPDARATGPSHSGRSLQSRMSRPTGTGASSPPPRPAPRTHGRSRRTNRRSSAASMGLARSRSRLIFQPD